MTQLSAPLPLKPITAVVPWRDVVYPCAFGAWVVINVSLLFVAWPLLIEVAIFAGPLMLAIADLLVRPDFTVAPPAPTITQGVCCGCGDLFPKDALRWDDGHWCPTCPAQPVSMELE